MDHHDTLMTIAQVGATFAGFAAVIGAFNDRQHAGRPSWIIRDVVEMSVIAAILAFVPVIVHGFWPDSPFWRISCGIFTVGGTVGFAASLHRNWQHWRTTPQILAPVSLVAIVNLMCAGMASLGVLLHLPDMVFLTCVIVQLSAAAYMFIHLLTVRAQSDGD